MIPCIVLKPFEISTEVVEEGKVVGVELYLNAKPSVVVVDGVGSKGTRSSGRRYTVFNSVRELQQHLRAKDTTVRGKVEKAILGRVGKEWVDVTELEDITERKTLVKAIKRLVLKGRLEYTRGPYNRLYVRRKEE